MRITIIKSDQKGIKALELGRSKLVVTVLLSAFSLLAIIAATFYTTKWVLQQDLVSETAIQKWQVELSQQKEELEPVFSPPIIVLLNSGMEFAVPHIKKEDSNEKA